MGETKTGAITQALRERLERESRLRGTAARLREMRAIAERCAALVGRAFRPRSMVISSTTSKGCLGDRGYFRAVGGAIREDEASRFEALIAESRCRMSVANVLEAAMLLESRGGRAAGNTLEAFLASAEIVTAPVTVAQLEAVRDAWRRYGKGKHPAALNFAIASRTRSPARRANCCCSRATTLHEPTLPPHSRSYANARKSRQ